MRGAIVADAGPLVALLDRTDRRHAECQAAMRELKNEMATVWPVVTEAAYLLGSKADPLLELIENGELRLLEISQDDIPRVRELMMKYFDLPMDLADASLVAVAERERIDTVLTLDKRDFSIYRPRHIKAFRLLP